jgi:hypothetical protein
VTSSLSFGLHNLSTTTNDSSMICVKRPKQNVCVQSSRTDAHCRIRSKTTHCRIRSKTTLQYKFPLLCSCTDRAAQGGALSTFNNILVGQQISYTTVTLSPLFMSMPDRLLSSFCRCYGCCCTACRPSTGDETANATRNIAEPAKPAVQPYLNLSSNLNRLTMPVSTRSRPSKCPLGGPVHSKWVLSS